jgi:arylsulfatase A-like enzyme
MSAVRNVLFIMCDQLRADYLSCYGHKRLATPNIDGLAARGTQFTRCYTQGSVCGPSRMSFYTGRYVFSHGATWNFVPLAAGERTLGDYARAAGLRAAVVGKTHAAADAPGIARFGLNVSEGAGRLIAEAGFEPYARDDGIVTDKTLARGNTPYCDFLIAHGYSARNPWHDFANSGLSSDGEIASGWFLRNSRLPARIAEEHSETAWTTDRACDFIAEHGEQPWLLHVSYIKPHWPYIAPRPYHELYGVDDVSTPIRAANEIEQSHPVYRAFREHPEARAFSNEAVRRAVIPTYMGLVKQIDDHIGRLLAFLSRAGRMDDTLIAFTSDHGDFLGDHWLGEKELFFEPCVRVPFIIYDPSPEAARGAICDDLVETIDLVPTLLEALERPHPDHVLEGRSLMSAVRGAGVVRRDAVFSELDYAFYPARRSLNLGPNDARAVMVRTKEHKLVHYDGFAPQLYSLGEDPFELEDRGTDPSLKRIRNDLYEILSGWMRHRRNRTTMSDEDVVGRSNGAVPGGVQIGQW